MNDLTVILDRIDHGDGTASAELLPLVYNELRRLAADRLAHEQPGQTVRRHWAYARSWLYAELKGRK